MLVDFHPIYAIFAKNILTEDGYYLNRETHEVLSGKVFTGGSLQSNPLVMSFATFVDRSVIVRTGPINTPEQANDFIDLTLNLHEKLSLKFKNRSRKPRIVCEQLDHPNLDFDPINHQSYQLLKAVQQNNLIGSVVYFSLPTDCFFSLSKDPTPSVDDDPKAQKFANEYNSLAWTHYAMWIAEEIQDYIENFPETLEVTPTLKKLFLEYLSVSSRERVAAQITNFSERLLNVKSTPAQPDSVASKESLEDYGKAVSELFVPFLQKVLGVLERIENEFFNIHNIKDNQLSIRRAVSIFRKILQTRISGDAYTQTCWIQQIILHQLLNDELVVVSSVSCANGLEKAHLAYGLKISAMQLEQKTPLDLVIDVAIHWCESVAQFNIQIQTSGFLAFKNWFSGAAETHEQVHIQRRAACIYKLRMMFFRILMDFCLPIQQLIPSDTNKDLEELKTQGCYLNALPSFLEAHFGEDEAEWSPYVLYDANNGKPSDLYPIGYRTLVYFHKNNV